MRAISAVSSDGPASDNQVILASDMLLSPKSAGKYSGNVKAIFCCFYAGALVFALGCGAGCDRQSAAAEAGAEPSASAPPPELKLAGIDVSTLTAREKAELRTLTGELMSPCADVAVPVAQCLNEKRACGKCVAAANFLVKGVRKGIASDDLQTKYKARFDPSAAKDLPIDGSPVMGSEKCPVTVTEFADFECPGCKAMMPVIDKVIKANEGKVKLVYKIVTLPNHAHARVAAEAALAAREQGKFWEMHHQLFENQDALESRDLSRYAKTIGVDVTKFRGEFKLDRVASQIERDAKLAEKVGVNHTPTLYVNGHEFMPLLAEDPEGELTEVILSEVPAGFSLGPGGSVAAPSASAAGSAAPKKLGTKGN